ncbi:MAG: redox-regulated ATPase YchF [Caldicoprobacter sp.]|uniref:redox-regulated ATPase YchF n=1 Tax=Caldicoprobacter sp. TaxID=2004500 RepID=UPI0039C04272
MKLGIVGLPNVGKSTLFNAITKAGAQAENYPFCTIEPNIGVVPVPDPRLENLAEMYKPEKVTPAFIEFVDIAGLVKGASKGEGLGNKFLSHIREVDAIVHVVRCFDDEDITHVEGSIDPIRDIEIINLELIFADLESLEKQMVKVQKMAKSGDKQSIEKLQVMEYIKENLEKGIPVRSLTFTEEQQNLVRQLFLLTSKPMIYAANISEKDVGLKEDPPLVQKVKEYAKKENAPVVVICAKLEEEIIQLDEQEKKAFLQEMGLESSGLDKLVSACYSLLGLISFLTASPKEVRAWTIKKGTKAPQAAGKIHSDFERGFIKAEVIPYDTLVAVGSYTAAKEKGLVRSEGKDYVIQDGDVVLFRFNV